MANKVILVVSFGTSYKETREKTIEALEKTVAERYKDWEVRRAFTSKIIIKKLKERDGIYIDYISEALQKLVDDGVKDVVVMPTHVMNGTEYDFVKYYTESFTDKFDSLRISTPLLTTEKDYDKVIDAINLRTKRGASFTILAVAEGAISKEDAALSKKDFKEKMMKQIPSVARQLGTNLGDDYFP